MTEPSSIPSTPEGAFSAHVEALRAAMGTVDIAVVLGSGWSDAVASLMPNADVSTLVADALGADRAGWPIPAVVSHQPTITAGRIAEHRVAIFGGRVHLYEGWSPAEVVYQVRTAKALGAHSVILTNAAGALSTDVEIGAGVLISDHLNLTGANPLIPHRPDAAPVGVEVGRSPFVDMTAAYDAGWATAVIESGLEQGTNIASRVYAGIRGPSFETPAEIRMFAALGAGLVGFSTVLETIAARHLNMRVCGLSMVTNYAAGLTESVSADEVIAAGKAGAAALGTLLNGAVARYPAPTAP